jgi:hypothetical protein
MTPASKLHKLTELTNEEFAYNEQNKALKKVIPRESEYLLDGVLYYRVSLFLLTSYCLTVTNHLFFLVITFLFFLDRFKINYIIHIFKKCKQWNSVKW